MNTTLPAEGLTKLFVGGIQPTCREHELRSALSAFSDFIAKIDIKMKTNYLNRGYAFIFISHAAVAEKMTKMKFRLGDRMLQVQNINRNSKEKEEYKLKRLYLKNLPPNTTDRELYQCFQRYGEIRSSYIIKDRFGNFRDYGFIDFERVEDVDSCLEELKKASLILRGSKIKVRRFIKIDDKKEQAYVDKYGLEDGAESVPQMSWVASSQHESVFSSLVISNHNSIRPCHAASTDQNHAFYGPCHPHAPSASHQTHRKTLITRDSHVTDCPASEFLAQTELQTTPPHSRSASNPKPQAQKRIEGPSGQKHGPSDPSKATLEADLAPASSLGFTPTYAKASLNHRLSNLRFNIQRPHPLNKAYSRENSTASPQSG